MLEQTSFGPDSVEDNSKTDADPDSPFAVLKTLKNPENKGG